MVYENITRDVLKVKGSGLYAILPFDNSERNGKTIIKIGLSMGPLYKRIAQYHTYYRNGLYILGLLEDPPFKINGFKTKELFYRHIEKEMISIIVRLGGVRLKALTSERYSEWIYAKPIWVHKAFQELVKKYLDNDEGGAFHPFELKGVIDKYYNDNINKKTTHVGEIIFTDL